MDANRGASKYSARVDRADANTSHALVLDLVGSDKRVLDVGCASGYLAEALVGQGNKVSGVELDPGAAEKARPHLDRLVVGDVEELDLVSQFGPGEFDVLVFADVLEHVKDPVDVLRRSRALLADGGYAVLSIPNVAHASVRLALLQGRFDYQPLGLLDDTHLRFFTRSTFEAMVADAGFVAVDTRQTTAGPFETEIRVSRQDYPDVVVAAVEADPESRAYQFVARVEPVDASGSGLGQVLAERDRDLHALRRLVADIARLAGDGPNHPVVGVLDAGGGDLPALRALRSEITRLELRRRLAGFEIRGYTLEEDHAVSGLSGDGVQALGPWHPGAADQLRATLDAVVVLPGAPAGSERMLDDLAGAGVAIHRMGADAPEVLALVGRLVGPDIPAQRSEYLQVTGVVPAGEPFELHLPSAASEGRPSPTVVEPPAGVSPLDLMGLVAAASTVVTDVPALAALAAGLRRPVAAAADQEPGIAGGDELERSRRDAALDRYFDDLYAALIRDAGSRLARSVPQRLAELQDRVRMLQAANAGLASQLSRERFAMAGEVARMREQAGAGVEPGAHPLLIDRLRHDLNRAAAENARLEAEIARIYATRTMRAVAPVRRIYSRLRSLKP